MVTSFSAVDIVFRRDTLWRAISFHNALVSTNDYLVQLPASELEGLVVVADATEGHGRWTRPADQAGRTLLVSFLVRFSTQRPEVATAAFGVALLNACQHVLPACELHWPHGIFVGGERVGGVRIDLAHDMLAVGVGIDLDMRGVSTDGARRGSSLAEALGADVDRWTLLSDLMLEMDAQVRRAREAPEALFAEYRERCASIGRMVTVRSRPGEVTGRATRIDAEGHLVLDVEGRARVIVGGEVESLVS